MTRRAMLFFALAVTLLVGAALAHGTKKHIMGTVEKVNAGSIVVKDKDGKSVEIKIVRTTVLLKSGRPAKLQDLAVGDRVVIHATPKGETLEADEIRFGAKPRKQPAPLLAGPAALLGPLLFVGAR